MRRLVCVILAASGIAAAVHAQGTPPTSRRTFEAVSIKRSSAQRDGWSYGSRPGGRWSMVNGSIALLLADAYPGHRGPLEGAPEWVSSERYDIEATADGIVSAEQMRAMLRAMLVERFHFVGRTEMREQPVYALVQGKSGAPLHLALKRSTVDCVAVQAARQTGEVVNVPLPANGAPVCGWRNTDESFMFGGITMADFATTIRVDRQVVDRTGLDGVYEFTLRYALQGAATVDLPSVFTALQEQLGFKLEPSRAAIPVLVVDAIERPTEN